MHNSGWFGMEYLAAYPQLTSTVLVRIHFLAGVGYRVHSDWRGRVVLELRFHTPPQPVSA